MSKKQTARLDRIAALSRWINKGRKPSPVVASARRLCDLLN